MRNIIAILRGIKPDEIEKIVEGILAVGILRIEVPLNSPEPFESIRRVVDSFKGQGFFGAGTVLSTNQVERLAGIGAQLIVSPNCDLEVIKKAKNFRMQSFPGVMTPSECFAALGAGADGLKLFPGELVGTAGLRAMRAVLPSETVCFVVGGVKPTNFAEWVQAGADGFGIGSAIYRIGDSADIVVQKAREIVTAFDEAFNDI